MRPLAKLLQSELSENELKLVPRSYDIVGSEEKAVAVIEIPEGLEPRKKMIAEALMKLNKHVKSVLDKISGRRGIFRLEGMELIAGDKNTEVNHREHGYTLKLNPQKVFFSPREATDRMRIASLVNPGEIVAVFFSGVCPYAIAICKKQTLVEKVYAIEINPDAHRYAEENVRINKLGHKIVLINDDVKKFTASSKIKFDRIVMPMAMDAEEFLDGAFKLIKENGVIHFYTNAKNEDLYSEAEKVVADSAKKNKKKFVIENRIEMLPFGVRKSKICLNIRAGVG